MVEELKENKRYYWLKLQSDFFTGEDIKVIRSQKNGAEYLIFWLQLLLKSITRVEPGILRFKENIPYDDKILASITETSEDVVRSAMKLFQELGMIIIAGNGDIWIECVKTMVGSETQWNRWKKEERYNPKWLNETTSEDTGHFPAEIGQELDETGKIPIELELELDKDKDNIASNGNDRSQQNDKIDFNFTTKLWNNIADEDISMWGETYPACDIDIELRRMREWLLANPEKRKHRYRRFITNWLTRSQDKGGTKCQRR